MIEIILDDTPFLPKEGTVIPAPVETTREIPDDWDIFRKDEKKDDKRSTEESSQEI
jgi:hypothetical protein